MGAIHRWSGLALWLWLELCPQMAFSTTLEPIQSAETLVGLSDMVAAVRIRGVEKQSAKGGNESEKLIYVAEVIETLKGDATGIIRFRYFGLHLLLSDSVNLIVAHSLGSGAGQYFVDGRPDCASPLIWKESSSGARVLALPRAPADNVAMDWYDPQLSRDDSGAYVFETQSDGSILLEDLGKKIREWTKSAGK